MQNFQNKSVLVVGVDPRGRAACEFLARQGAAVVALDPADNPELRASAESLRAQRIQVLLGATSVPAETFELAIISPAVSLRESLVEAVLDQHIPAIGELELAFQKALCLSIGITGTNGKSTTAGLVERMLASNHRKSAVAGHRSQPACSVVEQTRELDFLILQANAAQLERTQYFRPAVAVVLNLAAPPRSPHASAAEYAGAVARIFRNQQPFDWAIIQAEALAHLRELELPIPGKVVTFSATDTSADLHLERGLIISRLANWPGPLLDLDHCQLRGPHNAENLMAALAVGHALRLPLERMVDSLKTCTSGPHRCELVAEINGVQFVNDSKALNLDAMHKAVLGARPGPTGEANVWLIAGGQEEGAEYHDVGPALSRRVKRAFLLGEAGEKMRAAWSLFTPCTVSASLLEAVSEAARDATSGDVVLFSPACSGFDQFRNYQHRGEVFCQAVKSIGRGVPGARPKINDKLVMI